jgi:outer membrane immunogenic protein
MRSLSVVLASSVLAAFSLFGAPAEAADMPLKARSVAPVWSWSGFYAGASVGARWAENDWTSSDIFPFFGGMVQPVSSGAMNSVAARIGGYAGYNWQVAPAWVVGIEADFGWGNNSKTANPAPGTAGLTGPGCVGVCTSPPTATVKENWDGSVRGRVGTLLTPDLLLYATGGVAWQNVTISASCAPDGTTSQFCLISESGSASKTMTGWTVGAGVEHRLFGNWLGRASYRFADFGTFSHQFFSQPPGADDRFTGNVKVQTHTVELGLAYKF